MLSNFRRLIQHPIGAAVALGFVVLLGLAFVLSDRSGLGGGGSARIDDADVVATVGDKKITKAELLATVQRDLASLRQQQPTADMAGYLAAGGLEVTLDRLISSTAVRQFGEQQGMVVSKRAVDGIIAGAPGLQGADGKFDQKAYDNALRSQGISDDEARVQLTAQLQFRNLIVPATSNAYAPAALAAPYADLLLERRSGQIGLIPVQAVGLGAPPTDAELATYYRHNSSHYRVPVRRQLRYALVSPKTIAAQAAPSDAQVADAYRANAAKYAAADLRTIAQVIVADPAAAAALAAKVKAGTSLEQAARAAGLAPATLKDQQQTDYAAQSTPEIARAAFSAKQGDVVGPLRAPLGFVVARIEAVSTRPARSLAEVAPELRTQLTAARSGKLLADKRNAIDDALSNGKSASGNKFDAVLAQNGLTAERLPALTSTGVNPDDSTFKLDPMLAPLVPAGFAADPADGAQTVPVSQDGSFAVLLVERVLPAATLPLAQVRGAVAHDFQIERAGQVVRAAAGKVVTAVDNGTPLAQALAATGLKLPPPQPVSGPRAQLMTDPQRVPPPLVLLFSMKAKTAKLTAAPERGGYFVVYLDTIVPGNARGDAKALEGMRGAIGKEIGREYGDQLVKAIQQAVGTKKNPAALAAVKAELSGASAPAP